MGSDRGLEGTNAALESLVRAKFMTCAGDVLADAGAEEAAAEAARGNS